MSEQLDIEAIERVWAAATPGPWRLSDESRRAVLVGDASFGPVGVDEGEEIAFVLEELDAAAIAQAPQHIAALIAEVRRLKTLNAPP